MDGEAAAGRVRREVGRAEDPVGAAQVGREPALAPDPVPERDHVGAGGEQALGDLRGDPPAVGGVLAVDDAEVHRELLAQRGEPRLEGAPARGAEHVAHEEDPQRRYRIASVAAGCTSTRTWLPASFV